jgi:hypothetical protein
MASCIGYSVYKVSNWFDGKSYIGRTVICVTSRFRDHISLANRTGSGYSYLHDAIYELGAKSFYVQKVGDAVDSRSLAALEHQLIVAYDTFNNGYNARRSGRHVDNDSIPFPDGRCSCFPEAFSFDPDDAAHRLRHWRESRGLDLQKMKVIVGFGHISRLENRRGRPSPRLADRLQQVTGIPATDWASVVVTASHLSRP